MSTSVTGTEALRAATRAMPRPIWPAPMTPSFFISAAMAGDVEENWREMDERREAAVEVDLGLDISLLPSRAMLAMGGVGGEVEREGNVRQ